MRTDLSHAGLAGVFSEIGGMFDTSFDGESGDSNSGAGSAGKSGASERMVQKLGRENLLYSHADALDTILRTMEEVESALSDRPNRRQADSALPPTQITFGNDVENIMPSEFALLANEDTKLDFLVRFAQGTLYQTAPLEYKDSALILAIDTSGSMQGQRLHRAFGFAFAVSKRMVNQKRGFSILLFHDEPYATIHMDGRSSLEDMLKILDNVQSGGTNFQTAVERAQDIKEESKWKHLTLVMVTDGEDTIPDANKILDNKHRRDRYNMLLVKKNGVYHDEFRVFDSVDYVEPNAFVEGLIRAAKTIL
jgi:uncharacterized protein with von Willebrand factor type A (vWA) domain